MPVSRSKSSRKKSGSRKKSKSRKSSRKGSSRRRESIIHVYELLIKPEFEELSVASSGLKKIIASPKVISIWKNAVKHVKGQGDEFSVLKSGKNVSVIIRTPKKLSKQSDIVQGLTRLMGGNATLTVNGKTMVLVNNPHFTLKEIGFQAK
jgi:hypothetical protein